MTKFVCRFQSCHRTARKGWTTCDRHYTAGLSRSQWLKRQVK